MGELETPSIFHPAPLKPKEVDFEDWTYLVYIKGCFVTFHWSNIIYFLKGDRPLIISDVETVTSYVIDAHSETIIPARLDKSLPGPVVGIIEATTKLSDYFQLFTATSLSLPDSNGMVPLRMLNPTDTPVLLRKGTTVSIFSDIAPDDVVLPLEIIGSTTANGSSGCINKVCDNTLLSKFKCLPSETLTQYENNQLNELICNYSDIFAKSNLDLGRTSLAKHKLNTGNAQPIKQSPYRV